MFFIIISGKIQLWLPNPEIDAVKHERKDLECELEHVLTELKEYDGVNLSSSIHNQETVRNLTSLKRRIEQKMIHLDESLKTFDEMVPKVVMEDRVGFGEKALLHDRGRAGTCVAIENTHLAVVTKESYKKFLLKSV